MTATRLLRLPDGASLEYLVTGSHSPVTLFVPGLGGGIPDTRPLGSGVPGKKVFVQLPARGRYADLAADVAAVADETSTTRALGVSLGAGALCRLLVDAPDRFDKLVFFLPAVLDMPRAEPARARTLALSEAIASGSREAVGELMAAEVPAELRDTTAARAYVAQRTAVLLTGGWAKPVADLADQVAVDDAAAMRRVTAPVLVLGCRGDDLHPAEVATRLAAAFPSSTLHVYDEPGVLWYHRDDLRRRISSFLIG